MPSVRLIMVLLACCLSFSRSEPQPVFDHGVDLPTKRPLIVAHRGSSGTLPEHTVRAYQLAVDQGADVIECDVTITKDRVLICMHECWMSATTNVASVYNASYMSTYCVQGKNKTDYFTIDFTLSELRLVRKVQQIKARDQSYNGQFGIATLDEFISVAKGAGRPVGIYVETKDPHFINSILRTQKAGVMIEDLLLDTLQRFSYTGKRSTCFLQSFNTESLQYLANRTSLPIVHLIGSKVSNKTLAKYATYAYGIGPSISLLVLINGTKQIVGRTDLVERAHAFGLRVHPYILYNSTNEYAELFKLGVDGAHTDYPAIYYNFLNHTYWAGSGSPVAYLANKAFLIVAVFIASMLSARLRW